MRALALTLALLSGIAGAQAPAPPVAAVQVDAAVPARANALLGLLTGAGSYDELFAPIFRSAVSAEQFAATTAALTASLGKPVRIDTMAVPVRWHAQLAVVFERGSATMEMVLDPAPPHQITGLHIVDQVTRDDTLARVEADLRALPGTATIGVYALGKGSPTPLLEVAGDKPQPLGSAFKLWVLAEAARQAGSQPARWRQVVTIGPRSLPSGMLQAWPPASPVTIQTLATLMISISDNTATDTLMGQLGRTAIDGTAAATGLSTPVLTTREAFVLKGDAALRARWIPLDPAGRAALLARDAPRFAVTPLATGVFANGPVATDTIEWFASPRSTASLLDRIRVTGGNTARAILSINPGVDPATAARFAYLGFKGGSEPGVLSLNFLVQTKSGHWFAVAIAWHRPDGVVSEAQLIPIATRTLRLLETR
jgi:beta-lactamase class A